MRIKRINLKNYKRFTDLSITDVPETARLVVLVGPNGSGKSSVFDSFLLKARSSVANYSLSGATGQYYEKIEASQSMAEVASRVEIEFHGIDDTKVDWKNAFQIRSAYRNEADFQIKNLPTTNADNKGPRLARIIDIDEAVSVNYGYLALQGLQDLYHSAPAKMDFGKYRKNSLKVLQNAMRSMFSNPDLLLQDFGGMQTDSFRFAKGNVNDFHYKNLSAGEKAAFDILLDVFVKSREFEESVFCIDEPELHVSTSIQGQLIVAILKMLPDSSQLWVATHSIGIVQEAHRMKQESPDEVAFLDFSKHEFDGSVSMIPSQPSRAFWANIYKIALDDLSFLVAPNSIVICEGDLNRGFDAECYNRLFCEDYPETLFVSRGGCNEVIQSEHLVTIINAISQGTEVCKLVDRDDMHDNEREGNLCNNIRVLRRRELEEYLYDADVLRTFLESKGCSNDEVVSVLEYRDELLEGEDERKKIKNVSRDLFTKIRKTANLKFPGKTREQFALKFLVPALRNTKHVYAELQQDIFG